MESMKLRYKTLLIAITILFILPAIAQGQDEYLIESIKAHQGIADGVAFSPDGSIFASCSGDKTIKIWNAQSLKAIDTINCNSWVTSIVISPDGSILASGFHDNTIKLWDTKNWQEITTLRGHKSHVWTIAFSSDGSLLASGSEDKTVKLWDIKNKKEIATLWGHNSFVYSVAFNPEGTHLASGSRDKTIKIWSVKFKKELATFKGHDKYVCEVEFTKDGSMLISGDNDGCIKFWEMENLKQRTSSKFEQYSIIDLALSPDGTVMVSGGSQKVLRFWDVEERKQITYFVGHDIQIRSISFSPDGKTMISSDAGGTINIWDVEKILGRIPAYDTNPSVLSDKKHRQNDYLIKTLEGHTGWVWEVSFSPDGSMLASSSGDSTIKLWDVKSRWEIATLKGHEDDVNSVSFSADGSMLVSRGDDGTIKLWDVKSRREIATVKGYTGHVYSISFSPDGSMLASGSSDGTIKLWDVISRKKIATSKRQLGAVTSISFSPDGSMIASGGAETIRLWDVKSKQKIATLIGHINFVKSVQFSPDSSTLASGSLDNTIKLWDVKSRREIATLNGHNDCVNSVSFSPDGSVIATSSFDGNIKLWNIKSRKEIATIIAHTDRLFSVSFSPDGSILASGAGDNTIKLWDVEKILGRVPAGNQIVKPSYPPMIAGSIRFDEPSGNNILDAQESGKLILILKNDGQGKAHNLNINIKPEDQYSHVKVDQPETIPHLNPGEEKTIEIPISAGINVATQEIAYTIEVTEANGFDLYPHLKIRFNTQAFAPPQLAIVDYAIEDFNHNRKIERSEIVDLTIRIQNQGTGRAELANAHIDLGSNVFLAGDSKTSYDLGYLDPGAYDDIKVSLYTNTRATGVPITITLSEKHGKYGTSQKLDLPFDEVQRQPSELVVDGSPKEILKEYTIAPELVADVDRDIPSGITQNRNAIAVVIGNRDYECGDVPKVEYAANDASIMKEYLIKTLGYRDGNIEYLENAEYTDFRKIFGTKDNLGSISNMIKPGISDLFIYYSGHGAPNPNNNQGYFLPVDCCPADLAINGYPLELFYDNLAKLDVKTLIVTIDACFSGGYDKGMIIKQASPLYIEVDNLATFGKNRAVLASCKSDQISSWYPEKKHGIFTYFFLKALRGDSDLNNDGMITVKEIYEYVSDKTEGVPYYARRIHDGRQQTPTIIGDNQTVVVKLK
jgi:WD40 repeat protein